MKAIIVILFLISREVSISDQGIEDDIIYDLHKEINQMPMVETDVKIFQYFA